MDQRAEYRFPADVEVQITNLTDPTVFGPGRIADVSKSGAKLHFAHSIEPGTPIQIEIGDGVLFGFGIYSTPDGEAFVIGVELVRVLLGSSDLSRLLQSLLSLATPNLPGVRV